MKRKKLSKDRPKENDFLRSNKEYRKKGLRTVSTIEGQKDKREQLHGLR